MFIHDAQSEIDQFYKLFPKTPASLPLDETSLPLCLAETLADGENAQ
ncbi:hypothetical protein IM774_10425 [Erysipelotrichaceae bacterium RD49]|nr:hypothetical protein [Erysipelotrichaceae bacterium RD49]